LRGKLKAAPKGGFFVAAGPSLNSQSREAASWLASDEAMDLYDEAIFMVRRRCSETNLCSHGNQSDNGGAIMLVLILNAIYRQFLRAALHGISSQGARR